MGSPPSPFGRKVSIAASILGLDAEIAVERADTNDVNDSLRRQNPLGKLPVLIAEFARKLAAEYKPGDVAAFFDLESRTALQ